MRLPASDEFWRQRERFDFRFCCEDCGHFDAVRGRCVHGWPVSDHRLARYASRRVGQLIFCKEFELR